MPFYKFPKPFFLLLIVCLDLIALFLPSANGLDTSSISSLPSLMGGQGSSEIENIDSFDVNPKSGRWNITESGTDDFVTDSQLNLITVNNDTTTGREYLADRRLRKMDSSISYRFKGDGGGNQTEYFRDVLGDSSDFEEGDTEEWDAGAATDTLSVTNGVLRDEINSDSASLGSIKDTSRTFQTQIYSKVIARVKCYLQSDSEFEIQIVKWNLGDSYSSMVHNLGINTWITLEFDLDQTGWTGSEIITTGIRIYWRGETSNDVDDGDYLEFESIEIVGSLDYATHTNDIGDTWDWEDSNEYFYNVENNISDFNDLTTEDWVNHANTSNIETNSTGWLNITSSGTAECIIKNTGLSITASTYKWLTMQIQPLGGTIYDIVIRDAGNADVGNHSTSISDGEISVTDIELYAAAWTGTETEIRIAFNLSTNCFIMINMTFLYDTELGDIENFTTGTVDRFVHSEGYMSVTGFGTGTNFEGFGIPEDASKVIDTNLFSTITISMYSPDNLQFQLRGSNEDGDEVSLGSQQSVPTTLSEVSIDLSSDADWTGDFRRVYFWILETAGEGNFEGNEYFHVDYILMPGSWDDSESIIGLYDASALQSLVNISLHYSSNNSHSTTSLKQWIDIELLDDSGEIAYNYTSSSYVNLNNTYFRAKITYSILESEFSFQIAFDNESRIFKIDYPGDFTKQSGRTPSLFQLGDTPSMYISTFCQPVSWQYLTIDYIEAPFSERQWVNSDNPSDANWLINTYSLVHTEDNVDDYTDWELNVPRLDSMSGSIFFNSTNHANYQAGDAVYVYFTLYSVDASSGDRSQVFGITVQAVSYPSIVLSFFIRNSTDDTIFTYSETVTRTNPLVSFGLLTRNERQTCLLNTRLWVDGTIEDEYMDFYYGEDIDDDSQEFVSVVRYQHNYDGDMEVFSGLDSFSVVYRESWKDFINLGDNIRGNQYTAKNPPVDPITALINSLGELISIPINLLRSAVDFGFALIQAAIDLVKSAVDGLQPFLTGISDLLGSLWTALGDVLSDLWDTLVTVIGNAITDFVTLIINGIFTLYDMIWTAFGITPPDLITLTLNIAQGFAQLVAGVITFLGTFAQMLIDLGPLIPSGGLVGFFVFPIFQGGELDGFFDAMFHNMGFDISFGLSPIKIPAVFPWIVICMGSVLSGTIYAGFF